MNSTNKNNKLKRSAAKLDELDEKKGLEKKKRKKKKNGNADLDVTR